MTNKNLIVMGGVAAVLAIAGYLVGGRSAAKTPRLNGLRLADAFDIEKVAAVEIGPSAAGQSVKLAAGDAGWVVSTYQDYPADRKRIVENLLRLQEAKVGQVIRGKKIEAADRMPVAIRDAAGVELGSFVLGARHEKWGFGRYAQFKGETVLVGDTLDAFAADPKSWCDTKIVDEPYISFRDLAAPTLKEEELGLATGVVAKVTIGGDTNRTVTVGNKLPGGSERYLKIEGEKWVFIVPDYSVEKLLPKPPETKPDSPAEPAAAPAPQADDAAVSKDGAAQS